MSETRERPTLTQRMTRHINGGSKFSELHYEILADGEPTGITLYERTDGSPQYRYTARELRYGDETLDLMDRDGSDPVAWVNARLPQAVNGGLCYVCGIDGALYGYCDVHAGYRPLNQPASPAPSKDGA